MLLAGLFVWADALPLAMFAVTVAAACFAFLQFNFYPSRVFMGDSGSMPLGFLLASMSVLAIRTVPGGVPALSPEAVVLPVLAVFLLPGLDMARTMLTRIRQGRSPFSADRQHFHHALLDSGLNHGQAACWMYSVQGIGMAAALGAMMMDASLVWSVPLLLANGIALMQVRPQHVRQLFAAPRAIIHPVTAAAPNVPVLNAPKPTEARTAA